MNNILVINFIDNGFRFYFEQLQHQKEDGYEHPCSAKRNTLGMDQAVPGPAPTKLVFLSQIPTYPANFKVRFLGWYVVIALVLLQRH